VQTITFAALADTAYSTNTITLVGSASSGLPVNFSIESGPATLEGSVLSLTGVGTVVVIASQGGDVNYLAADSVTSTFIVVATVENQAITFAALPDRAYTTNTIPLTASSDSGLLVSFSVLSGPATGNGSALTLTGVGVVRVVASQLGNGRYLEATPVTNQFEVTRSSQEITFTAVEDREYTTNSFSISASANSGLGVSLSVVTGPATVNGNISTTNGNLYIGGKSILVGDVAVVNGNVNIQNGNINMTNAASFINQFVLA
jgi:hypothetical protein